MDAVQNTLQSINNQMLELLNNQYVQALLLIFFIFYAGLAAPNLPKGVAKLFDHTVFKVLILALILYVNNFNPTVAIVVAIGFFMTLQTLSRYHTFDMASEMGKIRKLFGKKEAEAAPVVESETMYDTGDTMNGNYGMNMETQVSGLANRTGYYQGPQGMQHPVGYGGEVEGADLF